MVKAIYYAVAVFAGLLIGLFVVGSILTHVLNSVFGYWIGLVIGVWGCVSFLRKVMEMRKEKYKNCPFCQTLISRQAIKCPKCLSDLS